MSFRISGKNIDLGEALRERLGVRIEAAVGKYFDRGYSGHVTVSKDGPDFATECALHLDSGEVLTADASAADAYQSADLAADKIEKQLRRLSRRRKDHQSLRAGLE